MSIPFAAIADDDTGATDLAGMLTAGGLRAVLLIDEPPQDRFEEWTRDADAVVLGVGSRALRPAEAYDRTIAGVRLLKRLAPRMLQVKYCSTFDSTAEGNIGPSIDAAMDATGERFTIALPALPVNGRTTFMGYHFVNGQLLSDSPMSRHPLTPMTNPNLVTHLQAQTRRRVGLAPLPVLPRLREHFESLRREGVEIAIVDCTSDADLEAIAKAVADMPLITGSSALAMALPRLWNLKPSKFVPERRPSTAGVLIVAGSCSPATRAQNERFERQGGATLVLDAAEVAERRPVDVSSVVVTLRSGCPFLLRLDAVRRAVDGLLIARGLAEVVSEVLRRAEPGGLIIAGGETSGAICRVAGFGALRVHRNIEPGVPLCTARGSPGLPVVLKSGNFGSDDFYARAMAAIAALGKKES